MVGVAQLLAIKVALGSVILQSTVGAVPNVLNGLEVAVPPEI